MLIALGSDDSEYNSVAGELFNGEHQVPPSARLEIEEYGTVLGWKLLLDPSITLIAASSLFLLTSFPYQPQEAYLRRFPRFGFFWPR